MNNNDFKKLNTPLPQGGVMRSYICGYDRYDNVETGQSQSAICIMKKDRVIYCTQKMWKIKIALWLMRLVGIRIIKEVN
jgi:hypothetical protein